MIFRRFLAAAKAVQKKPAKVVKLKSSMKNVIKNDATENKKSELYQAALFHVSAENPTMKHILTKEQTIIEKAWTIINVEKDAMNNNTESKLVKSKMAALQSLKLLSPTLYKAAIEVDYSLAPFERRIATLTCPENSPYSVY